MTDKDYESKRRILYYKEIIEDLRKELASVIEENECLKFRIKDLEEINASHQKLVGEILGERKNEKNR